MAKKQTRKSISICRWSYDRLKAIAESQNVSMSSMIENLLSTHLFTAERLSGVVLASPPVDPVPIIRSEMQRIGLRADGVRVPTAAQEDRFDRLTARLAPIVRTKTMEDYVAEHELALERTEIENPCRLDRCLEELHEAHGQKRRKKRRKRNAEAEVSEERQDRVDHEDGDSRLEEGDADPRLSAETDAQ